jgi:cation:H+ antiporter
MLLQFAILIAGLLLILFGANYLVDGSSSIAKKFGLSEFVIGLTIVGIGTSTPEMVVSFLSAIQGKADMAIGNVVGSNIFNTLLILGASAVVFPLTISKNALKKDLPLNISVTILLILLGLNFTIFGLGQDKLCRIDGIILLLIFGWYLWSSFKNDSTDDNDEQEGIKTYSPLVSCLFILGGLAALIFGGRLFVDSATAIAMGFGMSEKFIAITIMAAGTSMPELATSVVAAFKKKGQLALGNVIGSNISNILLILGGSAVITPLSFSGMSAVDMGVLLGCTVFLLVFAFTFKKKEIDRTEGIILLLGMAAYMWYLISNL